MAVSTKDGSMLTDFSLHAQNVFTPTEGRSSTLHVQFPSLGEPHNKEHPTGDKAYINRYMDQ
jgi:hypothetical protein